MAVELTPFGKFVKWVAFPAVLAAVGFRFVAPRVGEPRTGAIRRLESSFRRAPRTVPPPAAPMRPGAEDATRAAEFERVRAGGTAKAAPRASVPEASVTPIGGAASSPSTPRPARRERPPIDQTGP